jgi:glycerol-3-phosphate O-acyltransferase/dihydroxyacetone phosphate acyltransferase
LSYTPCVLISLIYLFRFVTSTFLAIFDQKTARILRENHQKLSNEINEIVDEFKPKVFPDLYNNGKI